jgi:adenosylmethionine-8-amino-7-oxononanoate aminotransferase
VAEPFLRPGTTLLHGITFGGHPVAAAIALKNIDIFERDRILDNVRELAPHLRRRMHELGELPIVADVRGDGFFFAAELTNGVGEGRLTNEERQLLVRDVIPAELRKAGLIARADDRGGPLVQIAPPLVCDRDDLDRIVEGLGDVLVEAGRRIGLR